MKTKEEIINEVMKKARMKDLILPDGSLVLSEIYRMLEEALSLTEDSGIKKGIKTARECMDELNLEIEQLTQEKEEMIERIYNELDNLNGEKGHLCLYCNAEVYDGKQGIIHEQDCIIMRLREELSKKEGR